METAQANSPENADVFEGVTAYHWLVFFMAAEGWLFDCMGQLSSMKIYRRERTHSNGTHKLYRAVYIFISYRQEHIARRRNVCY